MTIYKPRHNRLDQHPPPLDWVILPDSETISTVAEEFRNMEFQVVKKFRKYDSHAKEIRRIDDSVRNKFTFLLCEISMKGLAMDHQNKNHRQKAPLQRLRGKSPFMFFIKAWCTLSHHHALPLRRNVFEQPYTDQDNSVTRAMLRNGAALLNLMDKTRDSDGREDHFSPATRMTPPIWPNTR